MFDSPVWKPVSLKGRWHWARKGHGFRVFLMQHGGSGAQYWWAEFCIVPQEPERKGDYMLAHLKMAPFDVGPDVVWFEANRIALDDDEVALWHRTGALSRLGVT